MTEHVPSSAIREVIRAKMLNLHTFLPGEVVSFYPVTQTVDVKICLKIKRQVDQQLLDEEITELKEVPISYPRAKGYCLTMPVSPGDTCLLKFWERSIDNWLLDGGVVSPEDYRHHDFSDAIAYVGFWNMQDLIVDYNPNQPEFRTRTGKQKLWIEDDISEGFVEMVDLNNDSRMVLKADGEVRVANDQVGAKLKIAKSTRIILNNPKAAILLRPDGEIVICNENSQTTISPEGEIADKTSLGRRVLSPDGSSSLKNTISEKVVEASGKIVNKTLLSKLELLPEGVTKLGNSVNKLSLDNIKTKLGSAANNLLVSPALSSLGSKLNGVKINPTTTVLLGGGAAITPKLVTEVVGVVSSIADNLGLDVLSGLQQELNVIEQLVDQFSSLPDDEQDDPTSVVLEITQILEDNDIDSSLQEAIDILALASSLDIVWQEEVFNDMMNLLNEVLPDGNK